MRAGRLGWDDGGVLRLEEDREVERVVVEG